MSDRIITLVTSGNLLHYYKDHNIGTLSEINAKKPQGKSYFERLHSFIRIYSKYFVNIYVQSTMISRYFIMKSVIPKLSYSLIILSLLNYIISVGFFFSFNR